MRADLNPRAPVIIVGLRDAVTLLDIENSSCCAAARNTEIHKKKDM